MKRHDKPGAVVRLPVRAPASDAAPAAAPARSATILLFTGVQYERPRVERRERSWEGFRVEEAGRAS